MKAIKHSNIVDDDEMKAEYDFSKGRRGPYFSPEGLARITVSIDAELNEAFSQQAGRECTGYQFLLEKAIREYLERHAPGGEAPPPRERKRAF